MPIKDITGWKFGRLTAQEYRREGRKTVWACECECGARVEVAIGQLCSGKTKSCGCLRREKTLARCKTHGMSRGPEYRAYRNAYYRCTREQDVRFYTYGARGIEFKFSSFQQFIDDIGPRPFAKHSLDRINNDGHYEVGNVRWATRKEQRANRRDSAPETGKARAAK